MKIVDLHHLPEPMPVVMDRNETSAPMMQAVMDYLCKTNAPLVRYIDTPVFRDKAIVLPIQAADVWAYEAMKHADNVINQSGRSVRKSFEYLISDKRHAYFVCDAQFMAGCRGKTLDFARSVGILGPGTNDSGNGDALRSKQ
jgi:hypothetical protein